MFEFCLLDYYNKTAHLLVTVEDNKSSKARTKPILSKLIYTVDEKNIPNIIDCHLKEKYPILIIFGTNTFGTTGHQIVVKYSTSPNVCFCTTWRNMSQRNMS